MYRYQQLCFVKRPPKIKHSLTRESGCGGCSACCCWQRLAVFVVEMTPTGAPVTVGSHEHYFSRFRNKLKYQWITNDSAFYQGIISVVYLLRIFVLIPCSRSHVIFHPVNIKLHCVSPLLPCILICFGWPLCQLSDMTSMEVSHRISVIWQVKPVWNTLVN